MLRKQHISSHRPNIPNTSSNIKTKGRLVQRFLNQIKHMTHGIVPIHLDFLTNYLTLFCNFCFRKSCIKINIKNNIHSHVQVPTRKPHMISRDLFVSKRIQITSKFFNLICNFVRCPLFRSLKT